MTSPQNSSMPPVHPLHPAVLPLMRPLKGRWLAGVARGIATHLNIHVVWVRLIFLLLIPMYGIGALAYIALWVAIPAGDPVQQAQRMWLQQHDKQAPLAKPNAPVVLPHPLQPSDYASLDYTGLNDEASVEHQREDFSQLWKNAPKPALFAFAGGALICGAILLQHWQSISPITIPILLAIIGIGLPWIRYNATNGQLRFTALGIVLIFTAYVLVMTQNTVESGAVPFAHSLISGFALLTAVIAALTPWFIALFRRIGAERASKERQEERADMTAHLHDGVLQTLALIQLHADDPQQVFSLARSQERELRSWLYQERTTSDRSVNAGLAQIAAQVEDAHGTAIDVVTVGDAQPSAQTDALLDAAQQAMVNAVTHGKEPFSVYCEATAQSIDVYVRDHGEGFSIEDIPANRLGVRESIIGRVQRRGGSVNIVSRPQWGTEVHMHMPIADINHAARKESHD